MVSGLLRMVWIWLGWLERLGLKELRDGLRRILGPPIAGMHLGDKGVVVGTGADDDGQTSDMVFET